MAFCVWVAGVFVTFRTSWRTRLSFLNVSCCPKATSRIIAWYGFAVHLCAIGSVVATEIDCAVGSGRQIMCTAKQKLVSLLALALMTVVGCSQIRLPAIDPSGRRIFLPAEQATTLVPLKQSATRFPGLPDPAFTKPDMPPVCPELQANPCDTAPPPASAPIARRRDIVREGSIVLQPTKVIAPIDSDVVVFGGLCGADGYYRNHEKLEWSLSQESVGHFVEVREGCLKCLRKALGGEVGKQGVDYAIGRTSSHQESITRGTPTVIDDLLVQEGQGWVSMTSPSEGTSYVSCMAPRAEGWDRRRQTATIHWVDAHWEFPPNVVVAAGNSHELVTLVRRSTTGEAIENWEVNYTILSGSVPAGFAPAGGTSVRGIRTDSLGQAAVRLQQASGKVGPGTTMVQVDVVRPGTHVGDPDRLNVASAVVTVQWTSPALTLVATGPEVAGFDSPFTYQLEVSNPGDQIASGVSVSANLPRELEFVSANPPAQFAGGTLSWSLGDLAPQQVPQRIEVTVKAAGRGTLRPCFRVQSSDARLSMLEKCLETTVSVPCLGLDIQGPQEARVGDVVTYRIQLQNQCNETLRNVQLIDTYGQGLEAAGMPSPIAYRPLTLEPRSASEEIVLEFTVTRPGTVCHLIQVTADGGHTAESRQCLTATEVERPDLSLEVETATTDVLVGQQILVRARLTNTGNTVLPSMQLTYDATPSLAAFEATLNGMRQVENQLIWEIPSLQPGQTLNREVKIRCVQADAAAAARFVADVPGILQREQNVAVRIQAVESAPPGNRQPIDPDDRIRVPEQGQSGQLEVGVIAINEPVNVGEEVEYIVSVRNESAQADRNVAVRLLVPAGMTYVRGGADDQIVVQSRAADGRTVTMEPRREMRAGDALRFRVVLRATESGRKTFTVEAQSSRTPGGTSQSAQTTINFRGGNR